MPKALGELIEKGVADPIFRAQQAYVLLERIGSCAQPINEATFGDLFGTLQDVLVGRYALEVCKIFEPASPRYPIRSLPTVLDHLEATADSLPVFDSKRVSALIRRIDPQAPVPTPGPDLTRQLVRTLRGSLPGVGASASPEFLKTLESLKVLRDKRFAHNEAFDATLVHRATFAESQRLLAFVKDVLGAIGPGYTQVHYTVDDGSYLLDSDAARVGAALRRLLVKAGVIPDPRAAA